MLATAACSDGDLDGDGKTSNLSRVCNLRSLLSQTLLSRGLIARKKDYFVLFDDKILEHLLHARDKLTTKSRKLLHRLELPNEVKSSVNKETKFSKHVDPKWLSKAQEIIL